MSIREFTLYVFYVADLPLTRRVLSRGAATRGAVITWSHR